MTIFWDVVVGAKDFGGLVGLATGAFVLHERVFRDRPSAYLIARPNVDYGKTRYVYLRIRNNTRRTLICRLVVDPRARYRLALDDTVRSAVRILADVGASFPLDGEETRDLRVIDGDPEGGGDFRPVMLLRWRRPDLAWWQWNSTPDWLLWRTARVRVSPDMLKAITGTIEDEAG